jgi:hypothetical protein
MEGSEEACVLVIADQEDMTHFFAIPAASMSLTIEGFLSGAFPCEDEEDEEKENHLKAQIKNLLIPVRAVNLRGRVKIGQRLHSVDDPNAYVGTVDSFILWHVRNRDQHLLDPQ